MLCDRRYTKSDALKMFTDDETRAALTKVWKRRNDNDDEAGVTHTYFERANRKVKMQFFWNHEEDKIFFSCNIN